MTDTGHALASVPLRRPQGAHLAGDRKQTTPWQISSRHQDSETVQDTRKPVEYMRWPI